MSDFGSPFAFSLGGGPSDQDVAYEALKSAAGTGNSADGEWHETIREAWRMAKARGLSAAMDDERAILQSSPRHATDMIPMFEDLTNTYFDADAPDQQRRDALTLEYTRQLTTAIAPLTERLQAINPNAVVVLPNRPETRDTQFGRVFEDHNVAAPNLGNLTTPPAMDLVSSPSGTKTSLFPNFSSDFVMVVQSPTLLGGSLTEADKRVAGLIADLLNEALPSWVDYRIYVSCGYTLDLDPLDLTVFCA